RQQRRLANREHEGLEQQVARQQGVREKKWEVFHHRAHQVREVVHRLTELYRTHNLASRGDRGQNHETAQPRSFYEYVEITIPPALESLTWDSAEHARPDPDSSIAAVRQPDLAPSTTTSA